VGLPITFRLKRGVSIPLHWFANKLIRVYTGRERRPVFYDIDATMPELRRLDENFETILAELRTVLPRQAGIPRYHEADAFQAGISALDDRAWRVFFLNMHWAGKRFPTRDACPRTVELLDGIPNVLQAFFSILEPGKDVPPHDDPAMHYLRYHLGLIVPTDKPPRIRVHDEYYTWKTGESMFFDDSWNHEVENESEQLRVVLVVDVLRPMIWPLHQFNRLLAVLREPPRRAWDSIFERLVGGGLGPQVDYSSSSR